MNWVITGGCGFIGISLIKTLIKEENHNIRVLDNLTTGTKKDLSEACVYSEVSINNVTEFKGIELIVGDILDEDLAVKIVKGADEFDLVRSGLDDTMRLAYQEIKRVKDSTESLNDFRTACYLVALKKIYRTYEDVGVF